MEGYLAVHYMKNLSAIEMKMGILRILFAVTHTMSSIPQFSLLPLSLDNYHPHLICGWLIAT